MNIGILGAGVIGATLGKKWISAGHRVIFGSRNPERVELQELARSLGPQAQADSTSKAIAFADAVIFAVPGSGVADMVAANAGDLAHKVVIDTTNTVGGPVMHNMDAFAKFTPEAKVFRAFNTLGWENFENPDFGGTPADLFYCGPADASKAFVERLISDVGLRPVYIGGPEQAGTIDGLTRLWFALARGQGRGRRLAFKMLSAE